jgi:type I restriction enzyme, S subunit
MSSTRFTRVPLRDIASDIKDGTHGTHARVESGIPFLSAKNVMPAGLLVWSDDDDFISENEYRIITTSFAPKQGDLLVTVVGTLGRTTLFDGSRVAFQRSVAFVRPNSCVLSDYLLQASKNEDFVRQLERRSNATAQAGLYLGELAKILVPLPSLDQQKKISKILSTIDQTIAHTEALIQKYQQIKVGLMHDLFTRGITPDGKLRPPREQAPELYRENAIGWIPKEWIVKSIDEIRNPTKTITYGVLKPGSFVDGGVPLLQIEDVIHGDINYTKVHRISRQLDEEYSRTKVFGGEIVISLVGTIGKIALLPLGMERSNLHRNLGVISIDSIESPHFFFYLLQSHKFQELLASATMGSTQSLLNLGSLRNMNVPVGIERKAGHFRAPIA